MACFGVVWQAWMKGGENMVFEFKQAARIKVDAQIAGELCLRLQETGGLTPKRLLDASRDESSPLHNEFEWDDSIAAENYREQQANYIIRHLVIKAEDGARPPVRAFISIANEERNYQSIEVVLRTPCLREQMLCNAKSEMLAFISKYKTLEELTKVFEVMEETSKEIAT